MRLNCELCIVNPEGMHNSGSIISMQSMGLPLVNINIIFPSTAAIEDKCVINSATMKNGWCSSKFILSRVCTHGYRIATIL